MSVLWKLGLSTSAQSKGFVRISYKKFFRSMKGRERRNTEHRKSSLLLQETLDVLDCMTKTCLCNQELWETIKGLFYIQTGQLFYIYIFKWNFLSFLSLQNCAKNFTRAPNYFLSFSYQTVLLHLLAQIHRNHLYLSNYSGASVKSEGSSVLVLAQFRTTWITRGF